MNKNALWFLAAAMVTILVGCTADTSEGDDRSPPETEPRPVATSGSSVEPKATCIPVKIPDCDQTQTLTCSGSGLCRRCSCTWL